MAEPKRTRVSNKVRMVHVSLRIPPDVAAYYAKDGNLSDAMREVLTEKARATPD